MAQKTYQLKITLMGTKKPIVWRRVLVPSNIDFFILHIVIQGAMGWQNCHLFQFTEKTWKQDRGKWTLTEPDESGFMQPDEEDAHYVRLSSKIRGVGKKFYYTYDFGDSWEHEIELEKVEDYPEAVCKCIAGKGTCPPEDVGGIMGFANMKRLFLEEPESEEAESYRAWLGIDEEDYKKYKDDYNDFKYFSMRDANDEIKQGLSENLVLPLGQTVLIKRAKPEDMQ